MSRLILWIVLTVVALSVFLPLFVPTNVKASGPIYIREDGSVDPDTAPIAWNGSIYTFVDNVYNGIVVEKDSVVIDGNGYILQGNGSGFGLNVGNNVTLKNINIVDFAIGIWLNSSSGNLIFGNNITSAGEYGLYLENSCNNSIYGNNLENNFKGIRIVYGGNNTIIKNAVRAEAVYNDYGIRMDYSGDNFVSENIVEYNDEGIWLANSSNNIVFRNDIRSNYYGIIVTNSSTNVISGNNITNDEGIRLRFSSRNSIYGNNMTANGNNGIWLFYSSNNTIQKNNIVANRLRGVWLSGTSSNNVLYENIVADNGDVGILVGGWNNTVFRNSITNNTIGIELSMYLGNRFYHNSVVNNTQQVHVISSGPGNFWDNGYPTGGNYWSDHVGGDLNQNGIGDSWYEINQDNIDYYPLMGLFYSFNTSVVYSVSIISNSTIETVEYFEWNSTIKIIVSNSSTTQRFGFCRVRIPHDLMSEPHTVKVDGAIPIFCNYTLHDDGENRWIYFVYEHPKRALIIVSEFPSILASLFLIVGTLLTTIFRRKRQKSRICM